MGTDRKTDREPPIIPVEAREPGRVEKIDPVPHLAPYRYKPGETGNPGGQPAWKRTVLRVFGTGEAVYEAMNQLAQGNVVYGEDRDPETGELRGRTKIVPNAYAMIGAANFIADRATGKPTMTVQRSSDDPSEGAEVVELYDGLSEEEKAVLKMIAQRAAKAMRQVSRGVKPSGPAAVLEAEVPKAEEPKG